MSYLHTKKPLVLFLITWLHVSILDLFFVNYSGPVFLWAESVEPKTLIVHFLIALITTLTFLGAQQLHKYYRQGSFSIREPILIIASGMMVLSIGFILLT